MRKLHILVCSLLFITLFSFQAIADDDIDTILEQIAEHFGLEITHYDTSDFNQDGITDIAAILTPKESSLLDNEELTLPELTGEFKSIKAEGLPVEILFQGTQENLLITPSLWVATMEDGKFKVVYHTIKNILGHDDFGVSWGHSELSFTGRTISYYTTGGSSWRWVGNYAWEWLNGRFEKNYYGYSSSHWENFEEYSFNRRTFLASRSYNAAPTVLSAEVVGDLPIYSGEASFYCFLPGNAKKISIDGQMEIDWWNAKEIQLQDQKQFLIFGEKTGMILSTFLSQFGQSWSAITCMYYYM